MELGRAGLITKVIQLISSHHKSLIMFSFVSWIKCFILGIYFLKNISLDSGYI